MKTCVFIIFQLCPWIVYVGDWALRWTEGNETVQVFFVMFFFPVIMNALQYYIIDSFIQNQKPADHEAVPTEDGEGDDDEERAQRQRSAWDASFESEDEAEVVKKPSKAGCKAAQATERTKLRLDPDKDDEYDSDIDGDGTPTVIGSGSETVKKDEEQSLLDNGSSGESYNSPK